MDEPNPRVAAYIARSAKWRAELEKLRAIVLNCGLTEEFKWRGPWYTLQGSAVVGIGGLKNHCALWFLKGALMGDPDGILVRPGEHSQSMRLVRFASVDEIAGMEPVLRRYVEEAIAVEKSGLKVEFREKTELVFPEELTARLAEDPDLSAAFAALTPGRQRAYNLYFSQPKQSKTRAARVEKCVAAILEGKGPNDR